MDLTEQGQIQRGQQFLTDVMELLTSFQIWADEAAKLDGGEKERRIGAMNDALEVLQRVSLLLV